MPTRKIQGADVKTYADLGNDKSLLIDDDKIYVTGKGLNKTLKEAIDADDLGGSGGSGAKNFDPLGSMEQASLSDFSNSGGTLSITTTGSEVGDQAQALKFVAGASGQTVQRNTLNIPLGYRQNQFLGLKFQAALTSDWVVSVYDVTNSIELDSWTINGNGAYKPYEFIFGVPSSCEQLYWKFESTAADTLLVDDVLVTPDVKQFSELLLEQQLYTITTGAALTTRTTIEIPLVNISNTGDSILDVSNVSSRTRFTAKVKCKVDATLSARMVAAGNEIRINKNGVDYSNFGGAYTASAQLGASFNIALEAGDYIDFLATGSGIANDAATFYMTLNAQAVSDSIITNTTNLAPVKYSTNAGNAVTASTIVYLDFEGVVSDRDLQVVGAGSGNVTTSGTGWHMIAKRSGFLDIISRIRYVSGSYSQGNEFLLEVYVNNVSVSNLDYLVLQANTGASFTPSLNGADEIEVKKGDIIEIVAIQNAGSVSLNTSAVQNYVSIKWSDRNFTSNVALPAVAYIEDQKSSGVDGGTSTNTYTARDLNTLFGKTYFVSLLSNQFTLDEGEYLVEADAPASTANDHGIQLYNVSDAVGVKEGSTEFAPAATNAQTRSFLSASINITSPKTYEIRHRVSNIQASYGFGDANGFGINEVYTRVKITKLR